MWLVLTLENGRFATVGHVTALSSAVALSA